MKSITLQIHVTMYSSCTTVVNNTQIQLQYAWSWRTISEMIDAILFTSVCRCTARTPYPFIYHYLCSNIDITYTRHALRYMKTTKIYSYCITYPTLTINISSGYKLLQDANSSSKQPSSMSPSLTHTAHNMQHPYKICIVLLVMCKRHTRVKPMTYER